MRAAGRLDDLTRSIGDFVVRTSTEDLTPSRARTQLYHACGLTIKVAELHLPDVVVVGIASDLLRAIATGARVDSLGETYRLEQMMAQYYVLLRAIQRYVRSEQVTTIGSERLAA